MEPITHLNVAIEGVAYNRLLELEIKHSVNEHGMAVITVETDEATANDYLNRADEKAMIKITTSAEGQPEVLFCGVISNAGIEKVNEYVLLKLVLTSTSVISDIQKKNKSYQNTGKTYEDIMTQAVDGAAIIDMQVTDKAIGNMIVQCNETGWEFCKRMASRLGAPIITSIDREIPTITVGIPQGGNTYDLNQVETKVQSDRKKMADMMMEDTFGTSINTTQYMVLGDMVQSGSGTHRARGIYATLVSGMLVTTVCIGRETSFVQPIIVNNQIAGKMYTGKVEAVQGDTVQVHLTDIDSEFDGESTVWLPYSTAYSSSDGSGFYCMPAEGDNVRVFFPGSDEGEAFAASSVSVNVGADITDKQWTGPNGKQILLTKEGIYITTNANQKKIFIDLTDEGGITIKSDSNINICAKNNLSLISNNNISLTAENNILISSAESFIDIKPEGIEIGGDNVVIK